MTAQSKDQARLFAQLVDQLEPELRRGFMASVTDLQASVDWPALLRALEEGNIDAAIEALHIDAAAFAEYSSSMTSAYAKAGSSTAAQIVQQGIGGIGTRFNMSNPRAEEWIRENVGGSITRYTQEQRDLTRQVISEGYARGQGPRNIATDLVGRVVNGERTGGIMGLDGPRASRLLKVTEGMKTPEGVRDLVTAHADGTLSIKYKVNKATAQRILKAYRAGTEVPAVDRQISENQYRNALLKDRADTVARTETGNAVMSARMEQWMQLAEAQGLDSSAIIKTWIHGAGRTGDFRPDHLAMNGKSVRGLFTPFVFGSDQLQYACDPRGSAAQVINCRCNTTFRLAAL